MNEDHLNNFDKIKKPLTPEKSYVVKFSEGYQNRAAKRRLKAIKKQGARDPRIGFGKRATNGNKFRLIEVNWHLRICREMRESEIVRNFLQSSEAKYALPKGRRI